MLDLILFARGEPPLVVRILLILFTIVVCLLLIGLPTYLIFVGIGKFALKPLAKCFRGIEFHEQIQPGDVTFTYHTYRGLLLWMTQDEHTVIAPAAEAQRLLKRLLRFNLTWGMLSYGMLFVPFVAIGNYYAQLRSIRDQAGSVELS